MNPVVASTAWGPQSAIYGDPTLEDHSRRHLEAWAAAPGDRCEQRAAAVSLILNSHSDQLDLSGLGLTEIPPLSPDRQWSRVDLSHNSLRTWPAEPPAMFTALPPGAHLDLRGNPLGVLPAWAEAMAQRGRVLCDAPTSAHSSDLSRHTDAQRAPARSARTQLYGRHAQLLRRVALHLSEVRTDEAKAMDAASLATTTRALHWIQRHGPRLRALLHRHPRRPLEPGFSYVMRLHALHPTLDVISLSAMARCDVANVRNLLSGRRRTAALEDAK